MCKGDGQGTVNAPELNEFGQFWRPKSRMHGGCVVNVPRIQRGQFAHIQDKRPRIQDNDLFQNPPSHQPTKPSKSTLQVELLLYQTIKIHPTFRCIEAG